MTLVLLFSKVNLMFFFKILNGLKALKRTLKSDDKKTQNTMFFLNKFVRKMRGYGRVRSISEYLCDVWTELRFSLWKKRHFEKMIH